jgi:trehalose 6-phosphate phosphatase
MTQTNPKPVFGKSSDFFELLKNKKPALFLDYDGTLTPIVSRPEQAIISREMKDLLTRLSEKYTVAIITGRDMDDVKKLVGLDHLVYAGSHGFRISGPGGLYKEHEKTAVLLPELNVIENELMDIQETYKGVQIDRKRYAIGVHYRNAKDEDIDDILAGFDNILKNHPGYKKGTGKKIVEIKPALGWHKGKAVLWILNELGLSEDKTVLPIYIGDDDTDEDAFKTLQENESGVGIMVEHNGKPTHASYSLKDVDEVARLFQQLLSDKLV